MSRDYAKETDEIADLVERLAILHGDPERFHLVRDEARVRLRRMAGRLRADGLGCPKKRDLTTWRPSSPAAAARHR